MRLPLLPPFLACVMLAAGGFPPAHSDDALPELRLMSATELKAGTNGHFVTRAEINGSDITVLVDTGASAVALSYEDAESAGLHPGNLDFNIPVQTANGTAKAASVKIDRIEIDGVKVEDVDGMVLPEGALHGTLLGMSFLSRLSSFKVEDGVLYLKD
ncbi:TIGR02281 family clan AA aspartic protease [Aestuariivirga sp.]|uniref:TIGR02281 family clan AA aspartic protease n=1 Tax=Aestuariivirga sp. TaxID=2650926 RepID=UPI0039E2E1EF